ncbi:MAG: tetratricopeptide repeat protein [Blastocatellia bacterium]|nr:tetratricopeptide repeat protein [Blastocatellia bacterium]
MLSSKPILCLVLALLPLAANAQAPNIAVNPNANSTTRVQKAADVLNAARKLYSEEGPKVAFPEFENALTLFRNEKDRLGEAITIGLIGNCYKKFGDFPKALEFLQRALAMKRELGNRAEEGKTLSHLGLLYWEMGQYPPAVEHFNQAIALGAQLNDHVLEASAHNNLGLVYDELGEYRKSIAEYTRALELYRDTGFERGISDTIGNIGGKHLLLGEYSEALRYYQQALEIDQRATLKPGMSLDLQNIALCFVGMGRLPEALETFDRSIKLANEAGLKKEAADSQKGKASALVQLGKYTEALTQVAYEIATTATFTGSVTLAFKVPGPISEADFNNLAILHNVNGTLVDVTATSPARDYANLTIYATTTSFSPFYLARRGPHIKSLFDQSKAYKRGSTIPIKLQTLNTNNANVSSSSTALVARDLRLMSGNTAAPVVDSGNANPDYTFRYDATLGGSGGGYIFNLSTKGLAAGQYVLSFYVGSDRSFFYTVKFEVK